MPKVYITPEPTVNDPQRLTIKRGLHMLGFDSVLSVRAGKRMEIKLDGDDQPRQQSKCMKCAATSWPTL